MQGQSPAVPPPATIPLERTCLPEGRGCEGARFPFLGDLLGLSLHILIRLLGECSLSWVSSAPYSGQGQAEGCPSRGSERLTAPTGWQEGVTLLPVELFLEWHLAWCGSGADCPPSPWQHRGSWLGHSAGEGAVS